MGGMRALLAVALSVVVGCGGTAGTSGTSSSTPSIAGATPTATTAASNLPGTARPTQSGAASGQSQLGQILASARLTPYKITYRYTIAGTISDQTWYSKPPRQRFDFSTGTGAAALVISIFSLPEGTFSCFAVGTTSQCMAVQGASPLDQNAAASSVRAMVQNPGSFTGTFVETKTFAGQTGQCYDVTGSAAAVGLTNGRFCYTNDGLLLYSSITAAGSQITTEATQVSTTVPDSDFELPAKP